MSGNAEDSDEELMERIAQNDKKAFRTLADRHVNALYAMAFRMGFSKEDAEDVVQESLLRVWRKADTWRKDKKAAPKSWIYMVARNVCIDQKRKQKRTPDTVDINPEDVRSAGDSGERTAEQLQMRRAITEAMGRLPERQRTALVLCHYQGFTSQEAAAVLGTTGKGVEGLLGRARRQLKESLSCYEEMLT